MRPAGIVHLTQGFGREKSVMQRLGSAERSPGVELGKTSAIALFYRFENAHTRAPAFRLVQSSASVWSGLNVSSV